MPRNPEPTSNKTLAVPALRNIALAAIDQIREVSLDLHFWPQFQKYRSDCTALIDKASSGLRVHQPELLTTGDGGAYLLRGDDGNMLAIFKPFDEDPFSPRNPKVDQRILAFSDPSSAVGRRIKSVHRPGESAQKEVAAYLLDHKNEAGVPLTMMVQMSCQHWPSPGKIGSLQEFVPHLHDSWELSPSLYSKSDLHRIAILDMRLLNSDRHGGNILVRKDSDNRLRLVPIDHGFCLPDSVEDCGSDLWFEWMSWPQSRQQVDPELVKSVREIDLEEDARTLRGIGIREEAISTMRWRTVLLQQALVSSLTPLDVAEMICHRSKGGCGMIVKDEEIMTCRVEMVLEQKGYSKSKPIVEDEDQVKIAEEKVESPKRCPRRQMSAPFLCLGFGPAMTL
eukprot:TRINITY_DN4348_c0_g2_i1.p1 TRINITY_DN4348_c0_g2~~TRINITY_DN4348_c0_g2_i1.p1  ORF type:complete len:395 (+),score=75.35 TRINITY_DN4348_c0_g2_i1:174-1358(+)